MAYAAYAHLSMFYIKFSHSLVIRRGEQRMYFYIHEDNEAACVIWMGHKLGTGVNSFVT